jgi:gas vesicle protein
MFFMRIGKYEASERGSQAGTAVTFLLIGLGAGALIGLLLAPKSGEEMRKDLRRRYEDARDTVGEWAEDAKDAAKEAAEEAMDRGSEIADEVRKRVAPVARGFRKG